MLLAIAVVLLIAITVYFTFAVRAKDMPQPEPVSPTRHLEERKAAIYENLRDLQFEYRVGKLSDADYQSTKTGLQKELAVVLAEIENFGSSSSSGVGRSGLQARQDPIPTKTAAAATEPEPIAAAASSAVVCPHCGTEFSKPMKFCGECGKEMS